MFNFSVNKVYNASFVMHEGLTTRAYKIAEEAHKGQKRAEGVPYIFHPIAVVHILRTEWGITNPEILAAGFLHDGPEDNTLLTLDYIKREFGPQVASWIDGVSQFRSEKSRDRSKAEIDRETLRKVVRRNFIDPTVGILKLADRLHNMRTLQFMSDQKRVAKARETLDVYSPLAESLGMWIVKTELEDLSFRYTEPEIFAKFSKLFNEDPRTNDPFLSYMKSRLENIVLGSGVEANVTVRKNSLVRLKDKKHPFSDINDVASFRIVVGGDGRITKRDECYKLLGILREVFKDEEDQSRFDDFYNTPRFNQYSAMHITLDTSIGAVEIAITSDKKEDYNNWGVVSLVRKGERSLQTHALKLVFTPTGQVKFLPPEATGLELAYLIDKKMGAQATGMFINGKYCSISTVIPNGADVEIQRDPRKIAPNTEDVNLSQPTTKKKAEKQLLEKKMKEEETRGKEKVKKIISECGLIDLHDLTKLDEHAGKLGDFLNFLGYKGSLAVLYRLIEYGTVTENDLRQQLKEHGISKKTLRLTTILIEGNDANELLSSFSTEISNHGGNIRWAEGGSEDGKRFSQRFVIEKLSPEAEKKIEEIFRKDTRIDRVVIV